MSESTQIQTQFETQTQIKSNINVIEVPKRTYNVVRSIVDSSTKPIYEWNKPIAVDENVVKFVKYKVLPNGLEVKAWEIIVMPVTIQREGLTLTGTIIKVFDGLGNEIADLTIRDEFAITELDVKEPNRYSIAIDDIIIGAKTIHEYEYYVIKPSSDVPYANPISLAMFINKLMFFYSRAKGLTQNADASKSE
jgi:hypothetical protein